MNKKLIERAEQIILENTVHGTAEGARGPFCMLALLDEEGCPTVSVITAAVSEGIGRIDFCTGLSSNKAGRIAKCNRAGVCFGAQDYNITLTGTIEIVTDPQVKKQAWYAGMEQHFSGPEDKDYCVLRFRTSRYNLLVDWQEATGAVT